MPETSQQHLTVASASTSLGTLLMAASDAGVCYLGLAEDRAALENDLATTFPDAELSQEPSAAKPWLATARSLVEAPSPTTQAPPLDLRGTAFQRAVWAAMQEIPMAHTRSYAAIARAIDRPNASRAVAGACSANPVGIIVPCHRVIRADGGIGGYYWGGDIKRALLAREGAIPPATDKAI